MKVFLRSLTNIILKFKDHEFLELILFKLPWFNPTLAHGQNFPCFAQLALAVFPHDVTYISKVVAHVLSPSLGLPM